MPSSFFCPACGNANPFENGVKPCVCSRCNMNFAYAKFSSAPPVVAQPVQVIYREAPVTRQPTKYVEQREEYFEDIDERKLESALKFINSNDRTLIHKPEMVVGTAQGREEHFNTPQGPELSIEEIKADLSRRGAARTQVDTSDLDRLR